MKKLIYPLAFTLAAFLIIYSCSTEQENTIPPALIQTPEPETPAPTQYTLTVTSGEGGTVSTEGGTYDEGTEVTITATPNEGYEFVGWLGYQGMGLDVDDVKVILEKCLEENKYFKVWNMKRKGSINMDLDWWDGKVAYYKYKM